LPDQTEAELQREVARTQYGLRSLFFHRRLREGKFQKLVRLASQLDAHAYDWSDLDNLGISQTAWDFVQKRGNSPCRVFCHPEVIQAAPSLIAYYRGIAGLPLKGVTRLAFNTANLEAGKSQLTPERAWQLTKALNEVISAIVDSDAEYSVADAVLLLHATAGAMIDGSWRNQVGMEATRQVRAMIARYFIGEGLAIKTWTSQGEELELTGQTVSADVGGFATTNGYQVLFGSEPDIEVQGPNEELVGVIEVKGGIDPAGALERYGAAKKSFDEALHRNPRAFTLYLASVITPTVRERIQADRAVRQVFNLTNVILNEEERSRFLRELCWWMRL
jgi:hypothetical protein